MKKMTYKKSMLGVQVCMLLGAFWPTMPLVGWSHYALEGGMTSCSVTWNEQSTNVISYNLAIFVFVYILPVLIIVATNAKMLLIVSRPLPLPHPITLFLIPFPLSLNSSRTCPRSATAPMTPKCRSASTWRSE